MNKKLIKTDEPILIVQIALVVMFLSWPTAIIVAFISDGYAQHIMLWPIIALGIMTLNGTPTKNKWVDEDKE